MFPLDLDHQAGVMYAIHNFVDECLNFDMPNEAFIFNLERLWCAFEVFKQKGIEFAASIRAFIAVTEYINSQRGMLSFAHHNRYNYYRSKTTGLIYTWVELIDTE